ncbi:7 transmembrane sweet-taste receptor of 3 GCPR-domain-containing protein [Blastocladiella britannica]|nr:7 transmembrane sweet-taste receptor of 3 GCPR-domain-containing protein [Blastocladiella britannica]
MGYHIRCGISTRRSAAIALAVFQFAVLHLYATTATTTGTKRRIPQCISASAAKPFDWRLTDPPIDGAVTLQQPPPNITLEYNAWASANLTGYVAAMLLQDVMGVNVTLMEYWAPTGAFARVATGVVQANVEVWPAAKLPLYKQYVMEEGTVEDLGMVGYTGKVSWYINTAITTQYPDYIFDSYKSYTQSPVLSLLPPVGTATLARNADGTFMCTPANGYAYCGADGYFTPPQCQGALRSQCREFWDPDPGYSAGENEQHILTLGLKLVVAYVGYDQFQIMFAACARQSTYACLGYWWTPEVLPSTSALTVVNFPSYDSNCYSNFSPDAVGQPGNSLACDFNTALIMKLGQASMRTSAPQVSSFLHSLVFRDIDITSMLADYAHTGSVASATACRWLSANQNIWSVWIPKPPPKYIQYLESISASDGLAVTVSALTALELGGVAVMLGLMFKHRKHPAVVCQAPPFLFLIAIGVVMVAASIGVESVAPASTTSSDCAARTWLLSLGMCTVLASILIKTGRIFLLFGNKYQSQRLSLRTARLMPYVGGIVAVDAILLAVWQAVAQPQPVMVEVTASSFTYVCGMNGSTGGNVIAGITIGYHGLLMLAAVALGFRVRNVATQYNESKYIGMASYNILLVCIIVLPVLYLNINYKAQFIIKSALILLAAASALALLVARPILDAMATLNMHSFMSTHYGATSNVLRSIKSAGSRVSTGGPRRHPGAKASVINLMNGNNARVRLGQGMAIQKQSGWVRPWREVDVVMLVTPVPVLLVTDVRDRKVPNIARTHQVRATALADPTSHQVGCFTLMLGATAYLVQAKDAVAAEAWVQDINAAFSLVSISRMGKQQRRTRGIAEGETTESPSLTTSSSSSETGGKEGRGQSISVASGSAVPVRGTVRSSRV